MPDTHSQFALLKVRRFLPFFVTQFLGAFNDNVFKNALIIFITFQAAVSAGVDLNTLINVCADKEFNPDLSAGSVERREKKGQDFTKNADPGGDEKAFPTASGGLAKNIVHPSANDNSLIKAFN